MTDTMTVKVNGEDQVRQVAQYVTVQHADGRVEVIPSAPALRPGEFLTLDGQIIGRPLDMPRIPPQIE